jgi:hypothetical protein
MEIKARPRYPSLSYLLRNSNITKKTISATTAATQATLIMTAYLSSTLTESNPRLLIRIRITLYKPSPGSDLRPQYNQSRLERIKSNFPVIT